MKSGSFDRVRSLLPVVTACALAGACATTRTPTLGAPPAAASAERWGEPSVLQLAGCVQPKGPALVAGPYVTDVSASSATLVVQAAGAVAPTF